MLWAEVVGGRESERRMRRRERTVVPVATVGSCIAVERERADGVERERERGTGEERNGVE